MTSDIEKAGMMDVVDRTASEQRQWPTPPQAAFDALPADGSPAPLHVLLTALQRQSPGWSVAGVREALAGLVAAGRAYCEGEGWSRGVPEGWGWRSTGNYDDHFLFRDGDTSPNGYIACAYSFGAWQVFGPHSRDKATPPTLDAAQRAALRACWERGLFGPVAVAAGPRPITRAEKWTTIGAIGEALRVPRIGVSLHFGHDDALKSIALPVTGGERDLTVTERATLARAGIVPGPEGWCWAAGAGDPVAEVTPAPHFDEEPESVRDDSIRAPGPCARLLPPCLPGQSCGIAGCPQCSVVPDVSTYAAHIEELANDRAQRIRDALLSALAIGPASVSTLGEHAEDAAGDPVFPSELLRALQSIGAVQMNGWHLSDGPPPGWGWAPMADGSARLMPSAPPHLLSGTIVNVAKDGSGHQYGWALCVQSGESKEGKDGSAPTLEGAQSAALMACRRAGLFAARSTPVQPGANAPPNHGNPLRAAVQAIVDGDAGELIEQHFTAWAKGIEERAVRACLDRLDERNELALTPQACAFCGKGRKEVKVLIAAPSAVFICDECVKLSNEIVEGRAERGAQLRAEAAERRAQAERDAASDTAVGLARQLGKAQAALAMETRRADINADAAERERATVDALRDRTAQAEAERDAARAALATPSEAGPVLAAPEALYHHGDVGALGTLERLLREGREALAEAARLRRVAGTGGELVSEGQGQ